MTAKSVSGENHPTSTPGAADQGHEFLQEIEILGKALSLDPKCSRRRPPALPSSANYTTDSRSVSAGRSRLQHRPDSKPSRQPPWSFSSSTTSSSNKEKKKPTSSTSSSSSIPGWASWRNPIKALSHFGHRRFECRFNLHVHSIEGLPAALDGAALTVRWRRTADSPSTAAATHSARVCRGIAEFEETLVYRCSVYGYRSGRSPDHSAKYEPRLFVIFTSVVGRGLGLDLGQHKVDLTRLLPLSLEELEDEGKGLGKWSTSFQLSGKARGASLHVSFGFSLVRDGVENPGAERKVSEFPSFKDGKLDGLGRQGSIARVGSQTQRRDRSRSVEDIKVLHEVLTTAKSEALVLAYAERECEPQNCDAIAPSDVLGNLHIDAKPECGIACEQVDLTDLKHRKSLEEPIKGTEESPELQSTSLQESVEGNEEKECDESEFMVIEQGIEIASMDEVLESSTGNIVSERDDEEGKVGEEEQVLSEKSGEAAAEALYIGDGHDNSTLMPMDPVMEDLESLFSSLFTLESEDLEVPILAKTSKQLSSDEASPSPRTAGMKRSCSLDDVTESVADEFLNMLGIVNSPFGLSSDSDPESPRERLWKQFQKESLNSSHDIFGFGAGEQEEANWGDYSEDYDVSLIVHETETELQNATEAMSSKSRAKMLEDAETEALMREWGLDEKAFQCSPPGSRGGFGSPINLPPEEPLELPPLGEGLGPLVQTKDGGFLRSMNPSLFRYAKNNGNLIMQVSSPLVVPAEMGSGVMEILQQLALLGIEKLSMQASKLMPLEDITGKTMQQIAWEAAPVLESSERLNQMHLKYLEAEMGVSQNASGRGKKGKVLDLASQTSGDTGSEFVSLEDLAPLAMDKIEALSMEALRIQSDMSDEDAPSNISPQSIGEISALEGKEAKNSWSLGLEGTAGLQLLDIKNAGEDVDGLMGLCITLGEWMRLDSGQVDEEDQISERTSKILAAHHANSMDLLSGGWRGDTRGHKKSGRKWGLLGNNFTVALMVQLRDPFRNYEPVGAPMLALIQVERVFVPPKPKIYKTVSEKGNSEEEEDTEAESNQVGKEEKNEEDAIPQFKITEVHVAGLKTEPGKRKLWGNSTHQQSGSRWLLASGMSKSNKHPLMKSKAVAKPSQVTTTVQPGDTLWSISSRVHDSGAKWKDVAALNPHIRNPNIILPNQTIRLC